MLNQEKNELIQNQDIKKTSNITLVIIHFFISLFFILSGWLLRAFTDCEICRYNSWTEREQCIDCSNIEKYGALLYITLALFIMLHLLFFIKTKKDKIVNIASSIILFLLLISGILYNAYYYWTSG